MGTRHRSSLRKFFLEVRLLRKLAAAVSVAPDFVPRRGLWVRVWSTGHVFVKRVPTR